MDRHMGAKMQGIRKLRGIILSAVAIGVLSTSAMAQERQTRQQYDLEQSDLGAALRLLSRQSGLEIIYPAELVEGRQTAALHGRYSVREAMAIVLKGTDLVAEFRADGIVLRGRKEAPGEIGARPVGQDIVVTGSRIHTSISSSPLSTTSRESILDRGQTDLGGFIRSIPQNFTGGQNPTVFVSNDTSENVNNSSAFNLRGLGPDATLTLINGHRVAYDGVSQGVDVSAIPLLAIERIEVVADGASAIYGSDAVGGVANIILRRDYDGAKVGARYGFTADGGFEQQQYSAIAGRRWQNGGIFVAGDFTKWTAIKARQRDYATSFSPNDPILPAQRQFSAVLAGHQVLSDDVEFSIDAQYNNRRSPNGYSNTPPLDFYSDGQAINRKLEAFSVAPTVAVRLGSDWSATFTGMYSESSTHILNRAFFGSNERQRTALLYDNAAKSAELGVEGGIVELPAGTVRLASGLGWRSNGLKMRSAVTASGVTTTSGAFDADRGVLFAYGEVSVPIFGEANALPALQALTLNAAARYERYDGGQDVATPKIGIAYVPLKSVTLSATWGRSFKAQTLNQEFQEKNVALLGGGSIAGYPATRTFLYLYGGGTDLRPEKATTWSGTVAFEPAFLEGLKLQATYYDIRFRDRVALPLTSVYAALSNPLNADLLVFDPTPEQQAALIDASVFGLRNYTGRPYDPANVGLIVDNRLRNASKVAVKGVDLAADYTFETSSGTRFNLHAGASYLESRKQTKAGADYVTLAGTIYDPPHWRGQMAFDYQSGPINANATVNYIGGVVDDRSSTPYRIGSFVSADLTLRLRSPADEGFLAGIESTLAVQNLFNEKPDRVTPLSSLDPTWDSTNYSSVGRAISISVSKAF
ncbi:MULTISPECIES: TonB-dependent receptor [Novosphingobium]|uniref:TonB-dependent receptor n=1 Tax=Novosphingobium TaxID=165696 RepID=UPI0022F262FE|nr:TonB-dependent receptor [Novosphingobium resinovorum]